MAALQTLPAAASNEAVLAALESDGACIIEGLMSNALADQALAEVMPYVENTTYGRDDFTGRSTRRTGALVARSASCREIVVNEKILGCADEYLLPFATRIQLHLTQTICIGPGQGAQLLHRDRLAWGKYLPRTIEPQFNTIWALTDFSCENGGTRVVPGSHKWEWRREATENEICQAEMSKGSVLLYTGSVIHSGGENRTRDFRMGLNITYCLGWLRQEENQYLSCPPEVARHFPIVLQELLGYTQGNYALGYYSDPDGFGELGAGILTPEHAVGAKTRRRIDVLNPPE